MKSYENKKMIPTSLTEFVADLIKNPDWDWTVKSFSEHVLKCKLLYFYRIGLWDQYNLDGKVISVFSESNRIQSIEATIDLLEDSQYLSGSDYENVMDEYYKKFDLATRTFSEILGPAMFSDGSAATGFPADQQADWLSLWIIGRTRFMIHQTHEDKELPFRLSLVLDPHSGLN